MLWAPWVGAAIGVVAAAVLEAVRQLTKHSNGGTMLASALVITTVAVATRGLHLDGLADTADGLGSAKPAADALDIMKRSDIGPFGVVTLVLLLLIEVLALDTSVSRGSGGLSVIVAVMTGRLAAAWGCAQSVPAARPDGLGATVAGTLRRSSLALLTLAVLLASTALSLLDDDRRRSLTLVTYLAVLVGLGAALLLLRRCVRRFGGITGDVLGALVEVATVVSLCVFAIA